MLGLTFEDDADRQYRLFEGFCYVLAGMIVAVLLTLGSINIAGYNSVTIDCALNGTATVVKTRYSDGIVMLVSALFLLPLAVLMLRQIKMERQRRAAGT